MRKYFRLVFLLTILIFTFPSICSAEVSKLVFVTDSQMIAPDTLSEAITIQAEDENGESFQTTETIDLEFLSSSPSGEFLGGTGKPAQKYMSKNTAKRTFYYRDSGEGDFTLTINAKGRESGKEWTANQMIIVSGSAPAPTKEKKEPVVKKAEPKVEIKKEESKKVEIEVETKEVKEKEIVSEQKPVVPEPKIEKPKEKSVVTEVATVVLSQTTEPEPAPTSSVIIFESPKSVSWWSRFWHFLLNILV